VPDERIAWQSITGAENAGIVTLHALGEKRARITVQMRYTPEGMVESVGDALGVVERRIEGALERFKRFIASRGHETGAWRGTLE
jgi:uncharacterized membrane protein